MGLDSPVEPRSMSRLALMDWESGMWPGRGQHSGPPTALPHMHQPLHALAPPIFDTYRTNIYRRFFIFIFKEHTLPKG